MKTILVDAINCLVLEDGKLFEPMHDMLRTYPNRIKVLTGANDEQFKKFKLDDVPYEVFTLKHNPEKTDPAYYRALLYRYSLDADDVICFEHDPEAVESASSVGIKTYLYDNKKRDMVALKKFIDDNL